MSAAREHGGGFYHADIEPTENGFWVEAKDLREDHCRNTV